MQNWLSLLLSGGFIAFLALAYKIWTDRHKQLRIINAIYGKNNLTQNITRHLNNKVRDGRLKIEVNNEIAGDPAKNEIKILRVKYWHQGKKYKREYIEAEMIDLP